MFENADVISTYTDREAIEDGFLVAINRQDRVTRAAWEFLARYTPMDSQPPANWPVEMMGWFRCDTIKREDAIRLIAEHGKDGAQKKFEERIRDNKAKALSSGLISREGRRAREVYEKNIGGGIHAVWAKVDGGKLVELSTSVNGGDKLWLIPNENGGLTLMFPEDY